MRRSQLPPKPFWLQIRDLEAEIAEAEAKGRDCTGAWEILRSMKENARDEKIVPLAVFR